MADVRPILLSTLAALDKLHSQDKLLNTKELDAIENIRFNSKCQVCFINAFFKQNRPSVVSPLESPEGLLNPEYVTKKSDVWSFGCLFLYLLRGSHVFQGSSCPQILASICQTNLNKDGIRNILSVECGEQVVDIISECLQRVPATRPTIREILKHTFWAKQASGENMEMDVAKYFTTKINGILNSGHIVGDDGDYNGTTLNASKHNINITSAPAVKNFKSAKCEDDGNSNGVEINKEENNRPIIRDHILHINVDEVRLAPTTVTWAAAFSQSPVNTVHIMLSINVWKNTNDMNNYGKKFYANKWCDGSLISGTLADGSFAGKIRQHFRYNISSSQLFGDFNYKNNNENDVNTVCHKGSATNGMPARQQRRDLMAIILVRLESIIIGSAIVPLSNIGKMGVISGYYHVTHQGKIMGQIKVSASPTVPNIVEESSYVPILSMPSIASIDTMSARPSSSQTKSLDKKTLQKRQTHHKEHPVVPKQSIAYLYGAKCNNDEDVLLKSNAGSNNGQEDHFLTLLKITGGEESAANTFENQGIDIKTRLKNIRSAVDALKVFQSNNGKTQSLKRFAMTKSNYCDEYTPPLVTVNKNAYKKFQYGRKHNNKNAKHKQQSPLSLASLSSTTRRKKRSDEKKKRSPPLPRPPFINNIDIDSINILNRSDSSGNSNDVILADENDPPRYLDSLKSSSKNFQQMQNRLEKWSTWWDSQSITEDISLFGHEVDTESRSDGDSDSRVGMITREQNVHNSSTLGTWWQEQ